MVKGNFSKKIINWYLEGHRDLPWRKTKDPYRIWLSEVMLQQTRVAQGLPYYKRFIKNFPTVNALAKAPSQKVLREWQGLGYYSRARNLHACAKDVVSHHMGKFPSSYEELLKLPGVGNYTAAAIASIAFNKPVAVVDGNVFRVLSRVFGIHEEITSTGKKIFEKKANELLDEKQPGLFNQAVMEFGALHCTPRSPNCEDCIFSSCCFARKTETQQLLPVKTRKSKPRNRYFTYFVITHNNKIALKKRGAGDIWNSLYDFYLTEQKRNLSIEKTIKNDPWLNEISKESEVGSDVYRSKHVLTHQNIHARFVKLDLPLKFKNDEVLKRSKLKFYTPRQIRLLPKPVLISRFLTQKGILE